MVFRDHDDDDDIVDGLSTSCSLDSAEIPSGCNGIPELKHLQKRMGDFGLALFAPLLDATEEPMLDEMEYTPRPNDPIPIQIAPEPIEQLTECPRILTTEMIQTLREELPYAVRDNIWERVFAIGLHGDSFFTMTQQCQSIRHSVVVIRTTEGEVLGGYVNENWSAKRLSHEYYGSGQSFVFGGNDDLQIYKWTGHNDYCQLYDSDSRRIGMGGAGDFGWFVTDDFLHGQTGCSATFGNPPLVSSHLFAVQDFEVYGLVCPVIGFANSFAESKEAN